ncbi:MAG: hypothetical protein C4337_08555, partial [Armatimonadota bacterium]
YLNPELYGQPKELGIHYHPEVEPHKQDFGGNPALVPVELQVRAVGYEGASGLGYEPPDPRWLFQFRRSQWMELILHGDVDGSSCVDDNDLLQVLFQFGQGGSVPADQNGDGIGDDADVQIVLLNFGRCY